MAMINILHENTPLFSQHGSEHAAAIRGIYQDLRHETDLSPRNPKTNTLLSSLVSYLSHIENCGYCSYMPFENMKEEAEKLPVLCGEAECMMEKFWATHFLSKRTLTQDDLKEFWYYGNYHGLWELEKGLIQTAAQGKTLVFLGSGAMPFTAFFAAWDGYNVICIDYDKDACALSKDLVKKLGLSDKLQVVQHDASTYTYTKEHFVICASLITNKDALYQSLYMHGIESFAVRDAEGAYQFLYTPSPKPDSCAYVEVAQTYPNAQCINTLRLFTKFGGAPHKGADKS